MKKFALISGLLFLVVYFWVNTFTKEDSSFDLEYRPVTVSNLTSVELPGTPVEADVPSDARENPRGPRTYIIVASFGDKEQAEKMAEAYAAKYQADIIVLPPAPGGHYRISYGSYDSSGEAKAALETLRQTGFPDAWIFASR